MTTEQAAPDAASCDFAAMAAPTEAHDKLKPFIGAFKAEVKMWMGPGDPMVSTGTMENTPDLGGRFLHQSYKGDPNEGPFGEFEGRGYWGYNTVDNRYEGVWMDTASTMMQTETGEVDESGKVWTMIGQMTCGQTGQPMTKKSVITLIDDNTHTMEMFFDKGDGNECKMMEIQYTRA